MLTATIHRLPASTSARPVRVYGPDSRSDLQRAMLAQVRCEAAASAEQTRALRDALVSGGTVQVLGVLATSLGDRMGVKPASDPGATVTVTLDGRVLETVPCRSQRAAAATARAVRRAQANGRIPRAATVSLTLGGAL